MNDLKKRIVALLEAQKPFVFYKKPNNQSIVSLIQNDLRLYELTDFTQSGFVFSPFDSKKNGILFPVEKCSIQYFDIPVAESKPVSNNLLLDTSSEKDFHTDLVQKTINFIKTDTAQKVVISRKKIVQNPLENPLKIALIYTRLINTYPDAMAYIWHHPEIGIWMGATPEMLVRFENNSFFTMALAGTQLYNEHLNWQEKEKTEQAFVTQYIEKQLRIYSKTLYIGRPFTKKAGHLAHICTEISGKLNPEFTLEHLVNALHPTPAVCGTPKDKAKQFILQHEGYDRKFYTGFLGELNISNSSDLYVNLRCMEIEGEKVNLYIGGGITKDSDPEKEWEETVTKSNVLLKVLVY